MTEIVSDNLKEAKQRQNPWYDQTARERELIYLLNGSVILCDTWNRKDLLCNRHAKQYKKKENLTCHYVKKWHPPKATCFWTAEEKASGLDEEESISTWKSEYGVDPIVKLAGYQLN